jgi:MFS family permease
MTVLRNRSLVIIGIAESVSGIGNWITMLAVFAIVVFRGQGGVAQSSGIFLAGLLPTLLASPAAGWLCDRYDRKWLMIGSELLDGLIVAGLIFAQRLEIIYALLALQAVVMSVLTPARQAVVPDLVGAEHLTQANAFLQQLASMVKIGAPVLAGLILAVLDPHTAIILDVISFMLSALILTRLPALPAHGQNAPPAVEDRERAAGSLGESRAPGRESALNTLRGSPRLRLLFAGVFLAITVIIGFDVLSAVVVRDVLGGNEGFFGLLVGLVGLGSFLVAVYLLTRGEGRDPWRDLALGLALLGCLPASMALGAAAAAATGTPLAARLLAGAGCLAGGLGNGLTIIQTGTLLQRCTPPAMLGRISGLFQSTTVAGQLVGILVTPLLVPGLLSIGGYFVAATAALGLVVLYLTLSVRRTPQPVEAGAK